MMKKFIKKNNALLCVLGTLVLSFLSGGTLMADVVPIGASEDLLSERNLQTKETADNDRGAAKDTKTAIRQVHEEGIFNENDIKIKNTTRFRIDDEEADTWQKGYIGKSMSKSAATARAQGRLPKTDFKKANKLSGERFDALVKMGAIDGEEWHHTSPAFNKTHFYEWYEAGREIYEANKAEIDGMAERYAELKKAEKEIRDRFMEAYRQGDPKARELSDELTDAQNERFKAERDMQARYLDMETEYNEAREKVVRSGMAALQRLANGEERVANAMHRDDLEQYGGTNDITFDYGQPGDATKDYKGGYGISHIAAKHGTDTLFKLLDVIESGDVVRYVDGNKTVVIGKDGYEAVLALTRNGEKETWVLTGWKSIFKNEKAGANGEVSAHSAATQTNPTFSREDLGAALSAAKLGDKTENGKRNGEKNEAEAFRSEQYKKDRTADTRNVDAENAAAAIR